MTVIAKNNILYKMSSTMVDLFKNKTITVVIKTHTLIKIKTNNKTTERGGKKQW